MSFRYTLTGFLFFLQSMGCLHHCNGQNNTTMGNLINRPAYVSGKFYPADKNELKTDLKKLFDHAKPTNYSDVIAIISPHAGYVFSGEVAASAFNQIDSKKSYKNIFILASSHQVAFNGASVYCDGDYETPMGRIKVNTELGKELIKNNPDIFSNYTRAHMGEHSIEVQLPFLQYRLGENVQIVPIVLGTDDPSECKKIAEALRKYLNKENLFIISSDFSHYPTYSNANKADKITSDAILTNDPNELIHAIAKNKNENISGLLTSLCGWTSVLTFMYMTENNPEITYHHIQYLNSGDSPYGDHQKVVGYNAMAITLKKVQKKEFSLSGSDKEQLLIVARKSIDQYLENAKSIELDSSDWSKNLSTKCGAFVSLHKDGKLRGCIGNFSNEKPLFQIVQEMALASATRDSRFSPVKKTEMDSVEIEISVLTPMTKMNSLDELELGKHGIYIKKGFNSGTFLPQVATQTGWTKEEFLGHCSRDKAGLGWDGWKEADVFLYEAIVFAEEKKK